MATITEDYVSFKIAKLLKEKGFNEFCRAFRSPSGKLFYSSHDIKNFEDGKTIGGAITAPTLQMAMKWLLKKHNIFICVLFFEESNGFGYTIENVIKKKYITTSKNLSYKEPEEAVEVAIKYCLENLI